MDDMTKEEIEERIELLYQEIEDNEDEIRNDRYEIEKLEERLEKLNNAN